jgi:hypothetical protein
MSKTPLPSQKFWTKQNAAGKGKQLIPSAREVVNAAIETGKQPIPEAKKK